MSLPHSFAANLGSSICQKLYTMNDSISHMALTSWGGRWWSGWGGWEVVVWMGMVLRDVR